MVVGPSLAVGSEEAGADGAGDVCYGTLVEEGVRLGMPP